MADYLPLYLPGKAVPMTASAAITGGSLVYVSGDGTVATTTGPSTLAVGTAGHDVAASGDRVTVFGRGTVHRLTASGAITAGGLVAAAATGKVAAHTGGTNDNRVFGIALTTAADGATVEIMEV